MSELRKKISIASTAPLPTYGGIMGPIRRPFYETISNISMLISGGAEVYEHVGNKKIRLNMVNFDTDNNVNRSVEVEKPVETRQEVSDDSIIRISSNPNKNSSKNKKEKFYNEKVRPQVDETKVDEIVEE